MRVVVAGAGFAGLSAAVRLAKAKHEVTLLERSEVVGGRLRRIDGQWAHAPESFTLPGVVRDLFRKSGRPLERHLEIDHAPPRVHVFLSGRRVDRLELPFGRRGDQHDAMAALLGQDPWSPWLDSLDPMWDPLRREVLERVVIDAPTKSLRSTLQVRRSLAKATRSGLGDERLIKLVTDPHRLAGDDPRHVPAVAALAHLIERRFSRWHFVEDGAHVGFDPLADVLAHRLTERRITLRLGVSVHDVHRAGDRVAGVRTSDGLIEADHVVWCTSQLPASWPAPAVLPLTGPRQTRLELSGPNALPPDLWVHASDPLHVWAGAPGHWTVEHFPTTDPIAVLRSAGFDIAQHLISAQTLTASERLAEGHAGWQWSPGWGSGWKSFLERPGVAPPAGLTFAGAVGHLGPSLEMIGMTTSIQAAHLT